MKYAPFVEMESEKNVANASKTAFISCRYEANPINIVRIIWYHNDNLLDLKSDRYETHSSDGVKLEVRHVTKSDSGLYFCCLANVIGEGQPNKSTLLVVYTRNYVNIRMEPPFPVNEGDKVNVTLFCDVAQGYPSDLQKVK